MTSLRSFALRVFPFLFISLVLSLPCGALEAETWNETVLHYLLGGHDGSYPTAGLVFDSAGNLYGTTNSGGGRAAGVVFKLTPSPEGRWTETVLYRFTWGADGAFPDAGLILDSQGNLYGTTVGGGDLICDSPWGCGVVFQLSPSNGVWKETVLHTFTAGNDGEIPRDNLIFDAAGNLYGTVNYGGTGGHGAVYQLVSNFGDWTKNELYSFTGGTDGGYPSAGVIFDSAGNLYGTTSDGGDSSCRNDNGIGCGVVFELKPQGGGNWQEIVLHTFHGGRDGGFPHSRLLLDSSGNLYGNTAGGRRFVLVQRVRLRSSLQTFPRAGRRVEGDCAPYFRGGTDGQVPIDALVFDSAGNLYGTTYKGGSLEWCVDGCGTAFRLSPTPSGRWRETVLRVFIGNRGGAWPRAGVILDSAGSLYGTTSSGAVYKLSSH